MSTKVIALREHRYGSRLISAGAQYEIESASDLRTYKAVGFVKDAPAEEEPKTATPAAAQRPRTAPPQKVEPPPATEPTPPAAPATAEQPAPAPVLPPPAIAQTHEPATAEGAVPGAKRAPQQTYRRRDMTAE